MNKNASPSATFDDILLRIHEAFRREFLESVFALASRPGEEQVILLLESCSPVNRAKPFAVSLFNRSFISTTEMQTKSKITMLLTTLGWLHMLGTVYTAEPELKVVTKRADDKIEVTRTAEQTTLSVRSPSGIGSGVVSRLSGVWPKRVILRLHLSGLEGLKVSNSNMELTAEVAGPDNKKFLHLTKHANQSGEPATTMFAESEIRAFGKDGRQSKVLPLKEGYFEVRLPKELFADNPESITINWIDFYR